MRIAVLGCGNMGRAIIKGLQKKYGDEAAIFAYDSDQAALAMLDKSVTVAKPNQWFGSKVRPDCALIAVKPLDVAAALKPLQPADSLQAPDVLWISIAAGVSLEKLRGLLGPSARICRAMPNTPALIGAGVTAYALSATAKKSDAQLAEEVLGACGSVIQVPEKLLDAVTGLSGSGPAYVYLFLEALIEGGVTAGLPLSVAKKCAVQTVIGAARLVEESDEMPGQLKARVMSPGGTTAAGLLELEKNRFKYAVIEAVAAATRRAVELGRE
jgi:pyrroline-5-carboxylate reductase